MSPFNPFLTIYAATTRKTESDQVVSGDGAVSREEAPGSVDSRRKATGAEFCALGWKFPHRMCDARKRATGISHLCRKTIRPLMACKRHRAVPEDPPMKRVMISAAIVLLAVCAAGLRAAEDQSLSAAPAATLKAQLEKSGLQAIAARDPDEPGRYVAAVYIPEVQLLVVSAPYSLTAPLDKKIAAAEYMDVYVELAGVRDRTGHFFVEDVLADGIRPPSEPDLALASDTTTLNGATPVVFNGKWGAQQLTQEEYDARFRRDDERYARMLQVLSTALGRRTTVP